MREYRFAELNVTAQRYVARVYLKEYNEGRQVSDRITVADAWDACQDTNEEVYYTRHGMLIDSEIEIEFREELKQLMGE